MVFSNGIHVKNIGENLQICLWKECFSYLRRRKGPSERARETTRDSDSDIQSPKGTARDCDRDRISQQETMSDKKNDNREKKRNRDKANAGRDKEKDRQWQRQRQTVTKTETKSYRDGASERYKQKELKTDRDSRSGPGLFGSPGFFVREQIPCSIKYFIKYSFGKMIFYL